MDPVEAPASRDKVEQLLQEAHLRRMRKQWAEAEDSCREALEIDPDEPAAGEMLGDLLYDKGSYSEALVAYRRALEHAPTQTVLEEKIGRAVLAEQQDESDRLDAIATLARPSRAGTARRNALVTLLLCLICPGAGQLFLGQYLKGGILLGVGLVSLITGWNDLMKFWLGIMGMLPRTTRVNDILALVGFVGIAVYIYSLVDAAAQADRSRKRS